MYVILDDWRTWAPQFRDWITQRFSPVVLESFTRNAEPSWLEWLDTQQAGVDGHLQNSVSLFKIEVLRRYAGVRVFHATRMANLETVKEGGLRAWSSEELRNSAIHLSEDGVDPRILEQAIVKCDPETRGGYVYSFASLHHALGDPVDDASGSLPDFCRDGGEFLSCVRRQLGQKEISGPDTTAYLFACDLPWGLLEAEDLQYFAKTMLLTSLTEAYIGEGFSMHGENSCVTTSRSIPPENIALFSEVENLLGRNDLRIEDIHWSPLHTDQ